MIRGMSRAETHGKMCHLCGKPVEDIIDQYDGEYCSIYV